MKNDKLLRRVFLPLVENGFVFKSAFEPYTNSICLCKKGIIVTVDIDWRENTVNFKIKRGTKILLLMEGETVIICSDIKNFDYFYRVVQYEYSKINKDWKGLRPQYVQDLCVAFQILIETNDLTFY